MDPHSSYADEPIDEAVEPERGRVWIPAFFTAVFVTGALWALQFLSTRGSFAGMREDYEEGSSELVTNLIGGKLTYFGEGTTSLWTDATVRTSLVTVTVFFVAWVVTALGSLGIRPRAVIPMFLISWFAATLACVAGAAVAVGEAWLNSGGSLGDLGSAIDTGAAFGVTYGWAVAMIVALFWAVTPPRRSRNDYGDYDWDYEEPDSTVTTNPPASPSILDEIRGANTATTGNVSNVTATPASTGPTPRINAGTGNYPSVYPQGQGAPPTQPLPPRPQRLLQSPGQQPSTWNRR